MTCGRNDVAATKGRRAAPDVIERCRPAALNLRARRRDNVQQTPQTAPPKKNLGSFLGHNDKRAGFPGREAAAVKSDTRVIRIFPMQSVEQLGSFWSARLKRAKRDTVAVYPIGIRKSRVYRLEDFGCALPTFYDKGADRSETVALRFPHDLPRNTDPRADRLVQPIKPRSRVQQIALSAVFQPRPGADIADHRGASMDPDSGMAKIDAASLLLGAEAVERTRRSPTRH